MSGIPEALEVARKFGIKIIPGVEISTIFFPSGSEPDAEEAVKLICETGGIAVLAHPWALKSPVAVIRRLKEAGLHGIEAYRSDGKLAAYSDLADTYGLIKLGGSDFHGRGGPSESLLGSVNLPVLAVHEFLKLARPIWCKAICQILENYVNDPTDSNLEFIKRYGKNNFSKCASTTGIDEMIDLCLSSWLTSEERKNVELVAIKMKLSQVSIGGGLDDDSSKRTN